MEIPQKGGRNHLEHEFLVALTFHDHARNTLVGMISPKIAQGSYGGVLCLSSF